MRNRALLVSIGIMFGIGALSACSSGGTETAADTTAADTTVADSGSTSTADDGGATGDTTPPPATFCEALENWNDLTESDEFTGADDTEVDMETILGEWVARAQDLDDTAPPEVQATTAALLESVQAFEDLAAANDFDEEATGQAFEDNPDLGDAYQSAGEDLRNADAVDGPGGCDVIVTL